MSNRAPKVEEWAVYRLTRAMKAKDDRTPEERKAKAPPIWNAKKRGATQRSLVKMLPGLTRAEALNHVGTYARLYRQRLSADGRRCTIRDTAESYTGAGYPRIEEYLVAAPAIVATKHGRWGEENFTRFVGEVEVLLRAAARESIGVWHMRPVYCWTCHDVQHTDAIPGRGRTDAPTGSTHDPSWPRCCDRAMHEEDPNACTSTI